MTAEAVPTTAPHSSSLGRDDAISTAAIPDDHDPVFLYYDPHPVHRKMAEAIGAEFVACERGGVFDRLRAARNHDFAGRTAILEGGAPLLEGAFAKRLGNVGQLVALGADGTYHDLVNPEPYRTRAARLAHRFGVMHVDGTLAVSERIATLAEQYGGPARVVHPFISAERFARLGDVSPALDGDKVLCVARNEPKNGLRRLVDALDYLQRDVTVHFVGPGTKELAPGQGYVRHGYVDDAALVEHYATAALFVLPASVGAFPVATLEALRAGVPTVTTPGVGTASRIQQVSARLEAASTPEALADAIGWYFGPTANRQALSRRARNIGSQFDESTGLDNFVQQYAALLREMNGQPSDE